MKTIADFKRRMQVGTPVSSELYWKNSPTGPWELRQKHDRREVSIAQSNSFALKTWQGDKGEWNDSWCNWPKKNEFTVLDENTVQIEVGGIRLIYKFL